MDLTARMMSTKSLANEPASSCTETPPVPKQASVSVKPESPFSDSRDVSRAGAASIALRPPENPPTSDANVIRVPSHSGWFSWNDIHECEMRNLPEFFDTVSGSGSPSKNPRVYKYYRISIVKHFRDHPSRKITFTNVRKMLVGDVGSIRKVFDFLEAWGLINYQPASALSKPLKWEDKPTEPRLNSIESSAPIRDTSKRVCSGCKAVCTIACFACDKYDLTLCARCYVRGNYQVGVSSSDFRRVEISEETETDWTNKETLHLLEAIMHYGDDWRRVAQHVVGRTENECVARFIKLPSGEEFLHYQDFGVSNNRGNQLKEDADAECGLASIGSAKCPSKRMHLTPLEDASNPIMAQAAFLSALAGVEIARAAAQAAVTSLFEIAKRCYSDTIEGAQLLAQQQKGESDVEESISRIVEVQMRNIQDKLVRFEEIDLLMEKACQQLEQTNGEHFVDQLTLLFHRRSAPKYGECTEENNVKPD